MPSSEQPRALRIDLVIKTPAPFMDDVLRTLEEDPRLDVLVHFLRRTTSRRPWKSTFGEGYSYRMMQPRLGIDWHLLRKSARDKESHFVVLDWGNFSCVVLILTRLLFRLPVAIWIDTPQEQLRRPWWKRWPRSVFLRLLLSRLDAILATGEPARQVVIEMGAKPERTINLPWMVDLDRPDRTRADARAIETAGSYRDSFEARDPIVFSMIGRLAFEKGIDTGLRAFAETVKESTRPVAMLIAGSGPEESGLKELADELGISKHVRFLGWLEPGDVHPVYLASDAVVHPARWDPYPIVILDAMAWGLPVIASTACGNVPDRIVQEVNGFGFDPNRVDQLSTAMIKLVRDEELRQSIGEEARRTAEEWPQSRTADIFLSSLPRDRRTDPVITSAERNAS